MLGQKSHTPPSHLCSRTDDGRDPCSARVIRYDADSGMIPPHWLGLLTEPGSNKLDVADKRPVGT